MALPAGSKLTPTIRKTPTRIVAKSSTAVQHKLCTAALRCALPGNAAPLRHWLREPEVVRSGFAHGVVAPPLRHAVAARFSKSVIWQRPPT